VADLRKGYAFKNPDTLANDGWGAIITPDELRYVYAFGTPLEAPGSGHQYTDEQLWWYIDTALGLLELDLSYHFMKRRVRCRPLIHNVPRTDIPAGEVYDWDDPYDYRIESYPNFMYLKLRERPIISILSVKWYDPMGNLIREITDWAKPNYKTGSVEFYPTGSLGSLPLLMGSAFPFVIPGVLEGWRSYPDAFAVDYEVGYEKAADVWRLHKDIPSVVGKLAAINLLNDFGDGRTAALATSSVGLSGLSESFSTTMSATNAMYGARINEFLKELEKWWERNKLKYTGMVL